MIYVSRREVVRDAIVRSPLLAGCRLLRLHTSVCRGRNDHLPIAGLWHTSTGWTSYGRGWPAKHG